MKKILEDEGIALLNESGNYYLQYDAGELMVKIKRIKISEEEAKRVIRIPSCSYDIIISYQDRGIYGDDVTE